MALTSKTNNHKNRSPWFWIPSLYFAEGIPYVIAMTVSVIFYKRMGISNTDIALYTSWLYLPWVIKPLWSPVVDILKTKRFWIIFMQLIIGGAMASVAFTIPLPNFFQVTLAIFWLLAFNSATHDIAADGFYMMGLNQHQQAWFVGVRSTFYRFAMLTGQGLLVILAGYIESQTGLPPAELSVTAVQQSEQQQINVPDSTRLSTQNAKIEIVINPTQLLIEYEKKNPADIQHLLDRAKATNLENGHVLAEEKAQPEAKENKTESWWQRFVVTKAEKLIQALFGENRRRTVPVQVGNARIVTLRLSAPPEEDKEITVNFGRESGSKNIFLSEGGRFIFTKENWNKPAAAVIQLDPKLQQRSQALFIARAGNIPLAWTLTFLLMAILFIQFSFYHRFILPHAVEDIARKPQNLKRFLEDFIKPFVSFFRKKHIGIAIAFLLLYRLAESQLVKLASPFLLDNQEVGGLALTTAQLGFAYGTVGLIMLMLGGLLGGFAAAKHGLKKWLWFMIIAINLPDAVYIFLAHYQPDNFLIINLCVGLEQFGYGFGFTAFMLYMIYISEGEYKTAHFAITTGFMALGMMLPGMISGWIQEIVGYENFFVWVLMCAVPGFIVVKFLPLDTEFGKKK